MKAWLRKMARLFLGIDRWVTIEIDNKVTHHIMTDAQFEELKKRMGVDGLSERAKRMRNR